VTHLHATANLATDPWSDISHDEPDGGTIERVGLGYLDPQDVTSAHVFVLIRLTDGRPVIGFVPLGLAGQAAAVLATTRIGATWR
jgi:hypothetical protein